MSDNDCTRVGTGKQIVILGIQNRQQCDFEINFQLIIYDHENFLNHLSKIYKGNHYYELFYVYSTLLKHTHFSYDMICSSISYY